MVSVLMNMISLSIVLLNLLLLCECDMMGIYNYRRALIGNQQRSDHFPSIQQMQQYGAKLPMRENLPRHFLSRYAVHDDVIPEYDRPTLIGILGKILAIQRRRPSSRPYEKRGKFQSS